MGAVIKVSNGGSKGATGGLEDYLKKEQKTEKGLMYGKDCDVNNFTKDFKATKAIYGKTDGRQHTHFVQSWRPNEVSLQTAHEIGREFLQHEKFKGFQAVCITHKDREHIHNHIVINSVNLETGLKYDQKKKELQMLKEYSNEINLERGIEPEKKIARAGDIRVYDNKYKYEIIKKHIENEGKSYVVDTVLAVNKAIEMSNNKTTFIERMGEQGYSVKWSDERKENGEYKNKNITFENLEGKKVRLSNLEKTFSDQKYSREGLDLEFKRNERERSTAETIGNNRTADLTDSGKHEETKRTTNNGDRELLQLQKGYGVTGRSDKDTEESVSKTDGRQYESNSRTNNEQFGIEKSNDRGEQGKYETNNRDVEQNGQSAESGIEHFNRQYRTGIKGDGEGQRGNKIDISLDNGKDFENSSNSNRNNGNNNFNKFSLDELVYSIPDSEEERRTETTDYAKRRAENERFSQEIETISKPTVEIIETSKAEKELRRVLISRKIELYSAKENQTVYIEQRIHPGGKIEVRASKNKNPFDLPSNTGLKEYKNYTTLDHASINFIVDKKYKAVRQENTYDEDGEKVKKYMAYNEVLNKDLREKLEKIRGQIKEKEKIIGGKEEHERSR